MASRLTRASLEDIREPEWYVAQVLTAQMACSQPHGSHQPLTLVAMHRTFYIFTVLTDVAIFYVGVSLF